MSTIRELVGNVSFRGRLLLLLIAVSIVQVVFAALTYHSLQSKPLHQRIEANLTASLQAASPLIERRREQARDRLKAIVQNAQLRQALESGDNTLAAIVIAGTETAVDGSSASSATGSSATSSATSSTSSAGSSGASALGGLPATSTKSSSSDTAKKSDDESSTVFDTAPAVYVTDAKGEVIVGQEPDDPVLDGDNIGDSVPLQRGAQLIATIHVPVVFDEAFMEEIKKFSPAGTIVFAANADGVSTSKGSEARPKELKDGTGYVKFGKNEQYVLSRHPLDNSSLLLGAGISAKYVRGEESKARGGLWTFIGFLAVLMGFVTVMVTKSVGSALRHFAIITQRLARGELSQRIPVVGSDEIAVLSSSFNSMAENLEMRMQHLVEARGRLRRQVEVFGEALANANNANDMLVSVCTIALESTSSSRARFWAIDEEGDFEHAANIGLRPADTEPCPLEKQVVISGKPLRNDQAPYWLVVPARSHDRIVGLLTLVSMDNAFDADEVRLAERLAVQAAFALDNASMYLQLQEQATRDGLTGLANHRLMQEKLSRQLEEAYDSRMPLGVALLDVDNFKKINDTHGHLVGDEALKAIASVLTHRVAGAGTAARYGGEEFVVVMPGCDSGASCRIAEHIRQEIEDVRIPLEDGTYLRLTASFGVANVDQYATTMTKDKLLNHADMALYRAKGTGKNRVQLATPEVVSGRSATPIPAPPPVEPQVQAPFIQQSPVYQPPPAPVIQQQPAAHRPPAYQQLQHEQISQQPMHPQAPQAAPPAQPAQPQDPGDDYRSAA